MSGEMTVVLTLPVEVSRVSDHSQKVNSNLENKFESELKLATVLRGWLITRFEIGKFADQFAGNRIRRYSDVGESGDAVDVKKILQLAEDFQLVTLGQIEETRVAQINVVLRRGFAWIAFDADRSVGSQNAVAVEV